MRVLHVLTAADADGSYGGPLSVALRQAEGLRARGHVVDIVATRGRGGAARQEPGLVTYESLTLTRRLPFSSRVSAGLARALRSDLAGYDVVHVHAARDLVPLTALHMASRRGIPTVAQTHGMWTADGRAVTRTIDAAGAKRILRSARRVIALNTWEASELVQLGLAPDSLCIVPNAGPQPRIGTDLSAREPLVVFIGRLHPRKRAGDFVDMAAQLIADDGVSPALRFEIYGPDAGDLGPTLQRIHELPESARRRVTYGGPLSHAGVSAVLDRATVFVLPSRNEPFPMAVLEAMASGVPTVVTDTCHISGLITVHTAGLVADSSPTGLAAAVSRIITEPDLAGTICHCAQELLTRELSSSRVTDQLESVYDEVSDRS